MRRLYPGEYPVLPIGSQNLKTGQNKDFNVFNSWGTERQETVSLIHIENMRTGKYSPALLMGPATNGSLAHDQTHRDLGRFTVQKQYQGTYPQIFNQIQAEHRKRALKAYVYK